MCGGGGGVHYALLGSVLIRSLCSGVVLNFDLGHACS